RNLPREPRSDQDLIQHISTVHYLLQQIRWTVVIMVRCFEGDDRVLASQDVKAAGQVDFLFGKGTHAFQAFARARAIAEQVELDLIGGAAEVNTAGCRYGEILQGCGTLWPRN